MNKTNYGTLLLFGLSLVLHGAVLAAPVTTDWPRFRGPGGQGIARATGVPLQWGDRENLAWKTALPGAGASSPIVVGDRIFLTCYTGYNVPGRAQGRPQDLKRHLLCLDRKDGKIVWSREMAAQLPEQESIREDHGYASSTPASDGERVVAFFGKSGVFAFDLEGRQLWQANLGSGLSGWGSGASPILWRDYVIVNACVESRSLVALEKETGQEVWRAEDIVEAWNTPVVVPLPGGEEELVMGMLGKVVGFDPSSGELLWECANDIKWYIAPSVVAHDGIVWSIGGRSGVAAMAVRAGGRGDVTSSRRLWTGTRGSNVSSPILQESHLYWVHENLGIAYCAEAMTGRLVYEERLPRSGQIYASPVMAEGRLYYLSRGGRTFVLPARPEYELLAVNDLGERERFNASPAVTGSRLLLRSNSHLYCVGE